MARRQFPRSTFDQINVTPLIDTLFFLLIIFMVTAPLLEYTVEVHPPQMKASEMKPRPDSKIVSVKADGSIIFNKKTISAQELIYQLNQTVKQDPSAPIYLRADGDLKYKKVIDIMKMIRACGYTDVLLVMEEEPR